ncbi:protease modulator HflK [Pseudomonas sp. FSL R10-0056]|mgnify:FL=1|jgi:regulator of protease activity HflC (stomatin/prohibitin superfamily)|uniref:Protease modulator HflK n=2 Tax=Pseudomonas TaxID=286 RepID=A0ABT4WQM9_PSEFR|nr:MULTISPECIES: protease modulator HflK [Pseudomonas]MCH4884648.1 protease modulator HflK [Pseudomonas sp. TMW22080]MDA7022269.1 protease modulator HflK [Pseudomonas fragi]MDN5405749.1 protease modulator HflK [Pseudomonas sp.]MDN5447821.1 protease modulator HflK [Pseudomonas sp.]MDN5452342.1 protease modulator HflK [Pseudomonas sp.]
MSQAPDEIKGVSSPWQQAGRLAFLGLYAVTVFAAVAWGFSNVRQIDPQNRAVVLRMGALDRIQNAGLLWAWPKPFEQVVIVPAADRVSERRIENLLRSDVALQADRKASFATPVSDALAGSGYLLTGDAGVVQLDVRVFYNVTEPYAFVLQGEHVLPALDRLVTRSAVALSAARDLDTILVARPELIGSDSQAAERRERLRGDLVQGINQQLASLSATGQGIGLQVVRVDVQSSLPGPAVNAFNAVLTASQHAEQAVAAARNEAAKVTQSATQQADRSVEQAQAQASERLAKAQADTSTIINLAKVQQAGNDSGLMLRLYRERMPRILGQAGSVTSVDPNDDSRLIIQGAEQ